MGIIADRNQKIDKSSWPRGPWDDETDYVCSDDDNGWDIELIRNENGHWKGYVNLGEGSKLKGKPHEIIILRCYGIDHKGEILLNDENKIGIDFSPIDLNSITWEKVPLEKCKKEEYITFSEALIETTKLRTKIWFINKTLEDLLMSIKRLNF